MDEKSLQVLEWPKIKELVAAKTSFSLSRQAVLQLTPSLDQKEVVRRLALTREATEALQDMGEPPFGGASDIKAVVGKARLGGVLESDQLLPIKDFLVCSTRLKKYLEKAEGGLGGLGASLVACTALEREIDRCVDEEARLRDSASPQLSRLRSRMRILASRIRDRLDALIQSPATQKILQDPIVTIRNGRYVVPVRSEYRARFKGIVHDQSASGATLFMEPAFAVEINNDLHVAQQEAQAEEQRILKHLSGLVAQQADALMLNLEMVTALDTIFARARYSREIEGTEPTINDGGYLNIQQGRHPLLKGDVVPIDIWLGRDFHILVITGPNTGGKTVTLKTVGLLAVMAQAGLFIPASAGSTLPVFNGIFADIGDEQSIEQSLSTFSSHLTTIVGILDKLDVNSLVLLDELGAGTDPTEGAALATAILEHLRALKVSTIATTHFSDLKSYAYLHERVENASVEFDLKTLRPTFRLAVGIPGKSNAFAISRRLGLAEEIVSQAQSLLSLEQRQAADVISEMEANRRQLEQERIQGEIFRSKHEELKTKYENLLGELKERKSEIMEEARAEALHLMEKAQAEINQILGQARSLGREELEQNVLAYRQAIEKRSRELEKGQKQRPQAVGPTDLKPGEKVFIKSLRQTGFVHKAPSASGQVQVQAGIMKITVPVADLKRDQSAGSAPAGQGGAMARSHLAKSSTIRSEMDLRGKTVEDGLALVDKYLDDAFLSSLNQVQLIHGKGTGVLGEAIQQFLSGHPHVRAFRYGLPNEGGQGVTIVEIH